MNRGAWQTTVCGVTKSQTRLSTRTHTHFCLQQQIIVFVTLKHSNLLPTHQGLSVMSHLLSEDINGSFLVNSQYLTIKLGKPLTSAAFSSHSTCPSPSSRKPLTIPPSHECLWIPRSLGTTCDRSSIVEFYSNHTSFNILCICFVSQFVSQSLVRQEVIWGAC